MNEIFAFLPGIILLGMITSWQDIKQHKIRNIWIVLAIVYSVIVNLIIFIILYLDQTVRYIYYLQFTTNFLFSVGAGFLLWYFNIWTAGDGKLFIAYSTLIPLSVYAYDSLLFFPSITLLLNILITGFCLVFAYLLLTANLNNFGKFFKSFFRSFLEGQQLLFTVLYLFSMFWILGILLSLLGIQNQDLLMFLISLALFPYLFKKWQKFMLYAVVILSAARLFIDRNIYSISFLISFIIIFITWIIVDFLLREGFVILDEGFFSKRIKTRELKQGMILAQDIVKAKKGYFLLPKGLYSNQGSIIDDEPEGLTEKQIKKIQDTGIKEIKISKHIPFAPIIFLGVIGTLLANGNILILIINMLF